MFLKKKWGLILFTVLIILTILPSASAIDDDNVTLTEESENIYFNSSIENDGNGSLNSPYKYIKENRINNNSNIYLANGEYEFEETTVYLLKNKINVNIIGETSQNTSITFKNNNWLYTDSSLKLTNLTLYNTNLYSNGSTVTANNIIFKNSIGKVNGAYENSFGGTIYGINSSNIELYDCSFINSTGEYGGAIYTNDCALKIYNNLFLNTNAYNFGGAIACENSNVTINNTRFNNTKAQKDAGGTIYSVLSSLNINNSNVNNASATFGGALTLLNSKSTIINTQITDSIAKYNGGAIYAMYGNLTIKTSNFTNNLALNGGAIFLSNLTIAMTNNNYNNNTATITGGDIYSLFNSNINDGSNDLYESSQIDLNIISDVSALFNNTNIWNSEIPSYYNLADYGFVSPVKNQKDSGNCWAFTAMAVLESCILKASNTLYDLSEENLKNLIALYSDYGWNMLTNEGGNKDMVVGYLSSWLGPVLDVTDEFDDKGLLSYLFDSVLHVQNVVYLKRDSYLDNDAIKKAILTYGAVGSSLYYDDYYLNSETNAYYFNQPYTTNHAITIVGWNDTYSKNNFLTTPEGDGAWICKNSWSSDWGDNGYFYVSYYDSLIATAGEDETAYTIMFNESENYWKNYQYDLGKTHYTYVPDYQSIWYKNVFKSTDDEFLTAVSTYFIKDTEWEVYIYVGDELKTNKSGKSSPGYYTIALDELVTLKSGDEFSVIFKITTDETAKIPMSKTNRNIYRANVSFYGIDGEYWLDLYSENDPQVACIKAFTVINEVNSTLTLTVNSDSVVANVYNSNGKAITSGRVIFTINNEKYTVNVTNGVAKLNYAFDNDKDYEINATFTANGYVNSTSKYLINNSLNINFSIENITYGSLITLNITGNVNFNNLTVKINNKEYSAYSGVEDILDAGEYEAELLYNSFVVKTVSFNVEKLELTMNLTSEINMNDFIANVSFDVSCNGTLKVNDSSFSVVNGKTSFTLDSLEFGSYTLNLALDSNNYYSKNTYQFNIEYYKTFLVASNLTATYGNSVTYRVTLRTSDGFLLSGKSIKIKIDNTTYTNTTNNNGIAEFVLNLNGGNHSALIVFEGDGEYAKSNIEKYINIKKADLSIRLSSLSNYTHNIFNMTLSENINGTLIFSVSGTSYDVNITNGNAIIILDAFEYGNYTLNILFESDNFKTVNDTYTFTALYKTRINVTVNDDEVIIKLFSTVKTVFTGNLTVKINNIDYNEEIKNNQVIIGGLTYGNFAIQVIYAGDNTHETISYGYTLTTNKLSPNVTYTSVISYNEPIIINTAIDATGNIYLNISNTTYSSEITNGKAVFDIDLLPGEYNTTITYPGDNIHTSKTISATITVISNDNKTNLTVTYPTSIKYNEAIIIQVPTDTSGNITISINNNTYSSKIINGKSTFNIDNLVPDTYSLQIKYAGDEKYNSKNISATLTVTQLPTTINAKSTTINIIKTTSYTITLKDSNNNPVSNEKITAIFDGKTYSGETNTNGAVTFKLTAKSSGSKKITITYSGSTIYTASTLSPKITVNKDKATLKLTAKTYKKSVKTKKYTATLKNSQGKVIANAKVTLKINGKTYTAKTNKKGIATFKVTKLKKKGTFKTTVKFSGNSYYSAITKSIKIKVK